MSAHNSFDVVVVGAGPAGTTAALKAAQHGLNVALVERGDAPGAKNMFGGMLPNCPVLEELMPGFWDQAPWERHVVKRVLTIVGRGSFTSLVFEADSLDKPPYNGYTLFRPIFDRWYAEQASRAGAKLLRGTLVNDLLWNGKTVSGVRAARPDGEIRAHLVIACDGALSLLGEKAGLHAPFVQSQMALGIKALFSLQENEINERFNLVRDQGASCEFLGCTEGVRGGGFIYTQTETLSAGLVLHLDSLKRNGSAPYELFQGFLDLPPVRRFLKGSRLVEYSAHLLPEGGFKMVPQLYAPGMLIAGDAAGLCYTNGLNQEGMNLAITSGFIAAETALEAFRRGDFSRKQLSQYKTRLKESFVLKDMKTFQRAVDWMHNDRLFSVYPEVVGTVMEGLFRNDGRPRKRIGSVGLTALKSAGLPMRRFIADIIKGGRSLA